MVHTPSPRTHVRHNAVHTPNANVGRGLLVHNIVFFFLSKSPAHNELPLFVTHRSAYLGPYELELHGQHNREQQNAANHARTTCVGPVDQICLFGRDEPNTVKDGVLQRGHQSKVSEV